MGYGLDILSRFGFSVISDARKYLPFTGSYREDNEGF